MKNPMMVPQFGSAHKYFCMALIAAICKRFDVDPKNLHTADDTQDIHDARLAASFYLNHLLAASHREIADWLGVRVVDVLKYISPNEKDEHWLLVLDHAHKTAYCALADAIMGSMLDENADPPRWITEIKVRPTFVVEGSYIRSLKEWPA